MDKKVMLAVLLSACLSSTTLGNLLTAPVKAPSIIVPDDYEKIQWALGNASDGDTVFVRAGIYYEHLVVNRSVSLVGENRSDTVIDGDYGGTVVRVTASDVRVTGFTVRGSGIFPNNGIYVEGSAGVNISGNIVTDNGEAGIHLVSSSENVVSGNIVSSSVDFGIFLESSAGNVVSGNTVMDNWCGIRLEHSSHNTIFGNNISSNGPGAFPFFSGDNLFFHNNFLENTGQVSSHESMNLWDKGDLVGGNYWSDYTGDDSLSGPYQNLTGSDGIGDSPYVIDDYNRDNYPLMEPWTPPPDIEISGMALSKTVIGQGLSLGIEVTVENQGGHAETFNLTLYTNETTVNSLREITVANGDRVTAAFTWNTTGFPMGEYTLSAYAWPVPGESDTTDNTWSSGVVVSVLGDVNGDYSDDIFDVVTVAKAFGSSSGDEGWIANADFNDDGFIDIFDAVTVATNFGKT